MSGKAVPQITLTQVGFVWFFFPFWPSVSECDYDREVSGRQTVRWCQS